MSSPLIDLACRWYGASVLAASDESFGLKENLLVPQAAAFEPGHYDHRGEIVDGWETKRRREPGHDWALIRLGAAGRVEQIDIDTSFFTGNFPATAWVDGCAKAGYPSPAELLDPGTDWIPLVPPTALAGDSHNVIEVHDPRRFTHLRLSVDPDGGVARFRAFGRVIPDPREWRGLTVELSGAEQGGRVVWSSNDFYTPAQVLIRPDRARTMGEGWETARRRNGGHDSAVIELATTGDLQLVEIDTAHFKYNASAEIELFALGEQAWRAIGPDLSEEAGWQPAAARIRLQPDTRHRIRLQASDVAAVRLAAYPDGGISRLRVFGTPTAAGLDAALRAFDAAADRDPHT